MSIASEVRAWLLVSTGSFCLCAIGYTALRIPRLLPDLTATVTAANTALATVNHGCTPGPCGTLANINKLIVKMGDIAVDTHRQVVQSGTLINAASVSLTSTSQQLNAQLEHVGPLLDSAKGAADAVPATLAHVGPLLDTGRDQLQGFTPLFANANGAVNDARNLIASPSITGTLANVQSLSSSAAGIALDAKQVSDKATADYLKPVPWYLWPVKRSGQLLDVGAAVARHTP